MPKNNGNSDLAWPSVNRLSEYLLILEQFEKDGIGTISSSELAEVYGNTASQVRQDLFRLEETGRVGSGYRVDVLTHMIRKALGLERKSRVVIVGCGKLGSAIAEHVPFEEYGMVLAGIFDIAPDIVGRKVRGITVQDVSRDTSALKDLSPDLAALCVPPPAGQETADLLVEAGVKGILNYTRKRLRVPRGVSVQDRQMICAFIQLSFAATK